MKNCECGNIIGDSDEMCKECCVKKGFSWNRLDEKWTKLAEDHWKYVRGVLIRGAGRSPGEADAGFVERIEAIGWHYRGAMLHGIKHALDESEGPVVGRIVEYRDRIIRETYKERGAWSYIWWVIGILTGFVMATNL